MSRLLAAIGLMLLVITHAGASPLVLEHYFTKPTTGTGRFVLPIGQVDRSFRVTTKGRWDGKTLTLVEDFVFNDGERDRKTWRFTKIAPNRYEGRREDVIGTAEVLQDGDRVTLRYDVLVPSKTGGSPTRLGFYDILYLTAPGHVVNEAQVSLLFFSVGHVRVEFDQRGRRR